MFSLTRYTTPCPEPINAQILQMVVDNLTDISSVALPPSNLLYNIYQYAIGFEVHLYLEALGGSKGIAVELIVATSAQDAEKVAGFVLCLPVKDDPEACGIAFMAVQAGFRRQGVARGMMREVLARYPHAELACSVEKVCELVAALAPGKIRWEEPGLSRATRGELGWAGASGWSESRECLKAVPNRCKPINSET